MVVADVTTLAVTINSTRMSAAAPKPAGGSVKKQKGRFWQAAPFEDWIKEFLISTLVDDGDSVCELMSNRGVNLGKFQRANVAHYTVIEPVVRPCPLSLFFAFRIWLPPSRTDVLVRGALSTGKEHRGDEEELGQAQTALSRRVCAAGSIHGAQPLFPQH